MNSPADDAGLIFKPLPRISRMNANFLKSIRENSPNSWLRF